MSPFALYNLADGGRPSSRVVRDASEVGPGEAYSGREPGEGEVWDAAAGALRAKTAEELVRDLRALRKREISQEGKRLMEEKFAIGFAGEEFQALTAARAMGQPEDPRLPQAVGIMGLVRAAYEKLDAVKDDDPGAARKMREVGL